jgi:hypothetical protein
MLYPVTLGPHCVRLEPRTGGLDPIPGVRFAHVEVGGPGPNLEAQTVYTGVRHFPMGVRIHWLRLRVCHFLWTRDGTGPTHVVGSGAVAGPE